jgi:hypothetical protein
MVSSPVGQWNPAVAGITVLATLPALLATSATVVALALWAYNLFLVVAASALSFPDDVFDLQLFVHAWGTADGPLLPLEKA